MVDGDFVKNYALPLNLYKYRTVTPNSIDALRRDVLYFAPFAAMNDPMEGFFERSKTAAQKTNEVDWDIGDLKADLGLCCLSEDRSIDLMWVHYAGNFNGFCLEYNFTRLGRALRGEVEAIRVAYVRDKPTLYVRDVFDKEAAARKVLSCKKDVWAYEKEWRLIARRTGAFEVGDALDGIYIGPRTPAADADVLTEIGRQKKVDVWRVVVDGYRLRTESVHRA